MPSVLQALEEALATWRAAHPGQSPVAIRLGERLHAQLLLDIAASAQPLPHLETERGRPTHFHEIEIFCDEVAIDQIIIV